MLALLLAACSGNVPVTLDVAPTDPRDTPAAVAEVLRRRVERGRGEVVALTAEGSRVHLEARLPEQAGFVEGLLRPGKLTVHAVDETGGPRCGPDAAAVTATLVPVEGRAWLVETVGGETCGLLVEPAIEGAGDVADARLVLAKELAVEITLTPAAAEVFGAATTKLEGKRVALVVDGDVVASPRVMEPVTGGLVKVTFPPGPEDTVVHAAAMTTALAGGALHGPLERVTR